MKAAINILNNFKDNIIRIGEKASPSLKDRLVLMPKSRNKIFAYWDFEKESLEIIAKRFGKNPIRTMIGLYSENNPHFEDEIYFSLGDDSTMKCDFHEKWGNVQSGTTYRAVLYIPEICCCIESNEVNTPYKPKENVYNAGKLYLGP